MWPKYAKKADTENSSEASSDVWAQLQIDFEEDIMHNWHISDEEGVEAGKLAQRQMMSKMGPRSAWGRLFVMGMIKNPESTKVIKDAREAFCLLTDPILSEEEKRRPLEDIHKNVIEIAEKLNELTHMSYADADAILRDLEMYEILLENHTELMNTDGEARLLFIQTAVNIDNIKRYISSKFSSEET